MWPRVNPVRRFMCFHCCLFKLICIQGVIDIILILFFSRGFVTFDKMEAADQAIAEVIFLPLFLEMWVVK